jgi:2-phospho-L-lactate guanylyltransferase
VLTPLIPVKRLADAKSRLGPDLDPVRRRLLATAMLDDVLAAVTGTDGLARAVVVSPDREVWRRAEAHGARVVEEPDTAGNDLNASLAGAAVGIEGGVLVVASDLPLATPEALGRVAAALAAAPVAVVPSRDGAGTNVLGWAGAAGFAPAFGPGSAARHLAVPGAVRLDEPGLAHDADTAADLRDMLPLLDPDGVTGRRVRDLKLAELLGAG